MPIDLGVKVQARGRVDAQAGFFISLVNDKNNKLLQ